MRPQERLLSYLLAPFLLPALLVCLLYPAHGFYIVNVYFLGIREEESVLHVPGRVILGREQGIKDPECIFHYRSFHLREAHAQPRAPHHIYELVHYVLPRRVVCLRTCVHVIP